MQDQMDQGHKITLKTKGAQRDYKSTITPSKNQIFISIIFELIRKVNPQKKKQQEKQHLCQIFVQSDMLTG